MTKRFTKQIVTLFIFVLAFTFILGNPIDATAATKYVKVTFNAMGGSAVSAKKVVYHKYVPTPKSPKKKGYTFAGWYKDSSYKAAWNFKSNYVTKNTTLYAKWKPITYKVSFNSKGGSSVAAQNVSRNGLAKTPSKPARPGYSFVNWYKDTKYKTVWKFSSNHVTGNVTLYAKWITQSAKTVKFETNSGTPIASQTVPYNSLLKIPTTTKVGCTFAGWFKDSALTSAWNTSSSRLTSDITLYAKWTTNNYTVAFNSNGGSNVNSQIVAFGNPITQPPAPTKTGYTFAGWFTDDKLTTAWNFVTLCPANNVTLYAKWTINNYKVTFNSNGGTVVNPLTAQYSSLLSIPTAPTYTGYYFFGWYKDSALTTPWNFGSDKIAGDTTLYAKWDYTPNFCSAKISSSVTSLNVRTKPSTSSDSSILGTVSKNQQVRIYPSTTSGWYQLDYNGTTAFISGKLDSGTTTVNFTAYAAKVIATPGPANIYTTADNKSAVVGTLATNTVVNVIPVADNPLFVQVPVTVSGSVVKGYVLTSDIKKLDYDTLNIHSPSAVTATQINDAITAYETAHPEKGQSVFRGMGADFIKVATDAGINPVIFTAIAMHESAYGTSDLAKHKFNIFSLAAYDTSAMDSANTYSNVIDAMKDGADFLNKRYISNSISGLAKGTYMCGDFLGTGGLDGLTVDPKLTADQAKDTKGASGINYYYSTDENWGAGIASICEQILPYNENDYKDKTLLTVTNPTGLYNITLPTVDNNFSALVINGENKGSALTLYTTLGGTTAVTDGNISNPTSITVATVGNATIANNGTFQVLDLYGNAYNGWMQIKTTYSGKDYTGFVNFNTLSNYSAKFSLKNLLRDKTTWVYSAGDAYDSTQYVACFR
jgi:Listeria/Bacterioides repeat